MVLFPMQSHDFFEDFLFDGRQLHFPKASSMGFRNVNKELVTLVDVTSDGGALDGTSHLIALVGLTHVFAVTGAQGLDLADL